MKRLLVRLFMYLIGGTTVMAAPAYPRPHDFRQPDGSTVTLYAHGNEYDHYLTNGKGERVARNTEGYYSKQTTSSTRSAGTERLRQRNQLQSRDESKSVRRSLARRAGTAPTDYRGLVILVEFTDQSFRFNHKQVRSLYDGMLNGVNYKGYLDPECGGPQACPGSVRDYFYDNSYGSFSPEFDIVGPIQLNHKSTYINTVEKTYELTEEILALVDSTVDFSRYDSNGDGDVDMFYILYAGYSSMYQGNDERLVWPHATTMIDATGEDPDIYYDGVRMARFAVSAELYGWQQDADKMIDGIGTIVHEFSHVLGFQDHYDTSAGYQEHPNSWDVMDGGNYSEDYNRTPCAYNAFEKAVAGFLDPLDITQMDGDTIRLRSIEQSDDALILHSQQPHVHFYMENRQRDKWDKYLVGHGLLVWRVDSVQPYYWTSNQLNVTTRACFRLVRAKGTQGSFFTGVVDTTEDPFPGTANVTLLNNDPLDANLLSYDQYPTQAVLYDITEQDSIIQLRVMRDSLSDGRPITYNLPARFRATAEQLVAGEWLPVEWELTHRTQLINNQSSEVIYNLLPNTLNIQQSSSQISGQFLVTYSEVDFNRSMVPARRLCVSGESAVWLVNITDVEAGGGGSTTFTTGRNGIPQLPDSTHLALVSMPSSAYVATAASIVQVAERYRNIRFAEIIDSTGWEEISNDNTCGAYKTLQDGQVVIHRDGMRYSILGLPTQR